MKNHNLLSLLFVVATGSLVNAHAQTAQQPTTNWQPSTFSNSGNVEQIEQIEVSENELYGQPIHNGQNNNGQLNNGQFNNGQFNNGQFNNGVQQNTAVPQISYLGSSDGTTWRAAPQYAQANAQAFVANYQGYQLIMLLSIYNNRQVGLTIVAPQMNQQFSGRGEIAMDAIVFQINNNGTQQDGILYINRMPRFQGSGNMQSPNMPSG